MEFSPRTDIETTTYQKIVLASASPRRRRLFKKLQIPFTVMPSQLQETIDTSLNPLRVAKSLAIEKAHVVTKRATHSLVVGADTIVVVEGDILGKPDCSAHARNMLVRMRSKVHQVITAVALVAGAQRTEVRAVITHVQMRDYGEHEIDNYISTGEPMDKAGSYAIQGLGRLLVEQTTGCHNNVVGLPLCELATLLVNFDVRLGNRSERLCMLPSGDQCPRTV